MQIFVKTVQCPHRGAMQAGCALQGVSMPSVPRESVRRNSKVALPPTAKQRIGGCERSTAMHTVFMAALLAPSIPRHYVRLIGQQATVRHHLRVVCGVVEQTLCVLVLNRAWVCGS